MFWLLRRLVPKKLLLVYHALLVRLAVLWYRHPARQLTVVAVTGTSGKSTVVWIVAHLLAAATGARVGRASTIDFSDGETAWLNDLKMTMPGRAYLPRLLRRMVDHGCDFAIVEVTSEGIVQQRHLALEPDVAVFTNLSPEHLESHGSFERYQHAKEQLFASLRHATKKSGVPKAIVVNADDPRAPAFARYPADRHIAATQHGATLPGAGETVALTDVRVSADGAQGVAVVGAERHSFRSPLPGTYNVENLAVALAVLVALDVPLAPALAALPTLNPPPGRFEVIAGAGRRVVVDYAFHERALASLYSAVGDQHPTRIIHVLGGTGGGRDRSRRPVLGAYAADHAAIVIVTNEDPYDEDPQAIIEDVARGAREHGKRDGTDLFCIPDRREAIRRALDLARLGDLILVTGKASEQWIVGPHGQRTPWDDRRVVAEELARLAERGSMGWSDASLATP